ncbi:MAG: acetyl-CoA carboxylase carboxyl transferase subunit alpha, partial [Flavobacteriales bacterium]
MIYLEFENPIKEIDEQIEKLRESQKKTGVDMAKAIADLENASLAKTKELYSNLDPWQRVQVSRHPDRPYTIQYAEYLTGNTWIELHGDRT